MKIIRPKVEIISHFNGLNAMRHLEYCGRICYKSEDKITDTSAGRFCEKRIEDEHEAVLEHFSVTVKFIVDRGISHEIVRHRLASYSQESTRYCNYSKEGFGHEITVIKPCYIPDSSPAYFTWMYTCEATEHAYFELLEMGYTPQQARAVLPTSLKTELVMTANIREWRHFLKLRCAPAAHPQMREVALPLLGDCHMRAPELFEDIYNKYAEDIRKGPNCRQEA